ncbi:protein translocase subunit SecD [Candidatus Babeliales bacterium]|nr:protein translocase subunit SecD [Candidatus Babeliales bacterium]MBP9843547.1 protein translocase subunit SecD [Candidatus Babeliales bacterium]
MNIAMRRIFMSGFMGWLLFAALTVAYFSSYGRQSLKFGIDLVGGSYITLEVDQNDVIKTELHDKIKSFEAILEQANIELESKPTFQNNALNFNFASKKVAQEAETLFRHEYRQLIYSVQENQLQVTISTQYLHHLLSEAVDANINILERRLNGLSVAEIHISKQGDSFIVVELPDVHDLDQAKKMIGQSAIMEFKVVEDSAASREELFDKYDHELPEGTMVIAGASRGGSKMYYLVPDYATVSGKFFKNAKVDFGGEFKTDLCVHFEFDDEGGKRFHDLTSRNIGKPLAIVLDGEIVQVAIINSAIGKAGLIQGNFGAEEANTLARLLKSGAFKAKVSFKEERQIGPTLGQESVNNGLRSCAIGLFLLLVFGIYFYRLSGFFAILALAYNLVLILLFMALVKATLTLPGIAGMILTVGMAVDASILIYEQIKDCLSRGLGITQSVQEGFADAMMVILDANITTFIVAAVLFYFGTGPIQGFAVTMMIGIISTLITGLFFLKSIFKMYLTAFSVSKLSI